MPGQQSELGAYLPTTYLYDVQQLQEVDVNSEEFKELLVRLYQTINNIIIRVNLSHAGYYPEVEFVNGKLFFPVDNSTIFRQVFVKTINFGTLPNAGTKTVAHNIPITDTYSFTFINGAATDNITGSYIPLPYSSPVLANNIELQVDNTNVIITTGSNRTNYTISYVVLEYIKT